MKIREYARLLNIEVVGKLTYMGEWGLSSKRYLDEGGNAFLIDTSNGNVSIIPKKKRGSVILPPSSCPCELDF